MRKYVNPGSEKSILDPEVYGFNTELFKIRHYHVRNTMSLGLLVWVCNGVLYGRNPPRLQKYLPPI